MAADKRAVTEKFILEHIHSLTPKSTANRDLYAERFKRMSDEQFGAFIKRLESEDEVLTIIAPNHSDAELSLDNNLQVADKIGHKFFTKVLISGQEDMPDHFTPVEYMVLDLPIRRLSQTSDKKIRVPKSNKVIDALTGQVTGESKGAAISGPEMQVLSAMGLKAPLIEGMKHRGGDKQGRVALQAFITKYGRANLETLSRYQSGVVSTDSVRTYLTGAHLKNSL
jgi:hypothetical protein